MTSKRDVRLTADIGLRIRDIRLSLRWSLPELARRCYAVGYPLTDRDLSRIELGQRRLHADELRIIATVLGTTPHDLLAWADR